MVLKTTQGNGGKRRLTFPRFKIGDYLYSAINFIELKSSTIVPDEDLENLRNQDLFDFRK